MIRVAIYARFSSDLQNDRSVDDQIALCRDVCAHNGMTVVLTFEDRAVSASSAKNRPGFIALMRAAAAKLFDVVVAEDMDRIFRDQADYHAARKELDFLGITIHTATGKVTKIDGALRALMGEMYLENLALHVRRGLEGVIRDGRHAGGRAYGYSIVPGSPGELVIDDAQAEIVRRIFARFVAGATPRAIAAELNADRIAPPRGARWNASTINGNNARGHGMLLNELYVGRIVWNKVRMVKDPTTGKRISRINAKEQHRITEAPQLRVIDDATWNAAQAIKLKRSHLGAPQSRAPRRPLSGLLRCGSCGGGMVSIGNHKRTARLQCGTHKESGSCTNSRKVNRDAIEAAVFAGLKDELANPIAITEYLKVYNEERRRLAREAGDQVSKLTRRNAEVSRELERLIDAVTQGVDLATLVPRIKALEAERSDIAGQLQCAGATDSVTLHPGAIEQYRADVEGLAALAAEHSDFAESAELIEAVRRLVAGVIVRAEPHGRGFSVEVQGRLAQLTNSALFPSRSEGGGIGGSGRALPPFPTRPKSAIFPPIARLKSEKYRR
jgi:site-specific DNA recombinase